MATALYRMIQGCSDDVFTLMSLCIIMIFDGGSPLRVCGSTVDVAVRRVFRRREDTSNTCCDYVLHSTFSALTCLHHTNRKVLKKKCYEVTIKKCYKGQNLLSFFIPFIENKEIN
jgi:hypothetical protein